MTKKRRRYPIDPNHRPNALDKRVTTRNKSWYRHWAWSAFGIDVAVTLERTCEPMDEDERQAHMRRMLDAGW